MLGKSGRKIILCKYIWSFSVYIYMHPPDAGISLNWHKEKRSQILTHHFFLKKDIFLYYSLRETKYQQIIEFEGLAWHVLQMPFWSQRLSNCHE